MPTQLQSLIFRNGEAFSLDQIPLCDMPSFREMALAGIAGGDHVAMFFGVPQSAQRIRLYLVLANAMSGRLRLLASDVFESFPSLARQSLQFDRFECEIAEQWGVKPLEHPQLTSVRQHGKQRNHPPVALDTETSDRVHEVSLGPIHAVIAESGRFRLKCRGEQIIGVEIELGYQHRGIESPLIRGPHPRSLHYIETAAGDSSIAHALAYCELMESLTQTVPSPRAQILRVIALELERLANHAGDLGAIALDVGFQSTAAYCGRLRNDFLNAMALLGGNRYGRSLIRPGGVRFDLDNKRSEFLLQQLPVAIREVVNACRLLWNSITVQSRFSQCGMISREMARQLGLVGPVARACGVELDVRRNHPHGAYRLEPWSLATATTGDVAARVFVRFQEVEQSGKFILAHLPRLPAGELLAPTGPMQPNSCAISLVESWRGELCHMAITNAAGNFQHYKIVDPSFHNRAGLVCAAENQPISDFSLIKQSFNLSYAGHDL